METAGLNVIIGMGIVFVVLIFISAIIGLLKFVNRIGVKKSQPAPTVHEPVSVAAPAPVAYVEEDDSELVAVISAAIAAYESAIGNNVSADGLIVRSIKRRGFAK